MFPYRRLPGHITGLYIFTVANFLGLCHIALVQGDISVFSLRLNRTVESDIPDMPAYFGAHIVDDGIYGQVVYADPPTACLPIQPPPKRKSPNPPDLQWFVLIKRNECDFSTKVLSAQVAGYDAAIVHNVGSDQLEPMGPGKDTTIVIPSVFIGETDGLRIKEKYTYDKEYQLHLNPDFPMDTGTIILPFGVGVGTCFLIFVIVLLVKCIRDRRQRLRHRLPQRMLKQLPTKKYKKGDHDDLCAICLEDYVEGEKLRVLPCSHTYHIKCIDPWLTESRRTCPVCKRKVLPREHPRLGPRHSDSSSDSSDSDDGRARVPDESTPLLAAAINVGSGSDDDGVLVASGGHVNRAIQVEEDARRGHSAPSSYQAIPGTADGQSPSTSGGWYQSFGSPPGGSPDTSSQQQLPRRLAFSSTGELLSSGEHSLNGDCVDFAPIEEWFVERPTAACPVEIAVDVGGQREQPSAREPSTSSSPSSTKDAQSASSSSRGRRSGRQGRRSEDHDLVV